MKINPILTTLLFSGLSFGSMADERAYPYQLLDYEIKDSAARQGNYDPRAILLNTDKFVGLGEGGWIAVKMSQRVYDQEGADLMIEEFADNEQYEVFAAAENPMQVVKLGGVYTGSSEIDLENSALEYIQYVYIQDVAANLSGDVTMPGAEIIKIIGLHTSH